MWLRAAPCALLLLSCAPSEPVPDEADAGSPSPDDGGDPGDAGGETQARALVSIALSPAAPELPVGASVRMSAVGSYDDGTSAQLSSRASWSSDAPAIATVGTSGAELALVRALSVGTATVRASVEGVEGAALITVTPRALVALEVSPPSAERAAGQRVQLTATGTYDDDTTRDVTLEVAWSSQAPAVASVDASGLVTTALEGSVEITASAQGQTASSAILVGPPVVVQLDTFNKHSAALLSNGSVLAFGHNRYAQTGSAPASSTAACQSNADCAGGELCDLNAGSSGVCSTFCLASSDCGAGDVCECVQRDGQGACVKGWCLDLVTTPTLVPGVAGVVKVATTGFCTFALLEDGTVIGWGRNTRGLFLGDGDEDGRSIERAPKPLMKRTAAGELERLQRVVDLRGGIDHAVALDEDGRVWTWGRGWVGQLGNGDTADQNAAVEVTLPPEAGATERTPLLADAIATGSYHTLALERGTGRVLGWGWNSVAQLGEGTKVGPVGDNPDTPAVDGQGHADPVCARLPDGSACLLGVDDIDGGWAHTLALVDDQVLAWGWNAAGQLGDGTFTDRLLPVLVVNDVVDVETGFVHGGALTSSGALLLWGGNGNGQLADGTATNRALPAALALPASPALIKSGSDHSLALLPDGRVYAWGWNRYGELGLGDRALRDEPTLHPTLSP